MLINLSTEMTTRVISILRKVSIWS